MKKMVLVIIIGFLILILSKCTNTYEVSYAEKPTIYKKQVAGYAIENLLINNPLKDSIEFNILSYSSFNNQDYLCVFNDYFNTLEIYNLTEKKPEKLIEVPNRIYDLHNDYKYIKFPSEFLKGIHFQNFDSVFLLFDHCISLIDSSANLKFIHKVNEVEGDKHFPEIILSANSSFPVYYDNISKCLFCRSKTGQSAMGSSKYFNFPIEASFDLQTKTFDLLPVQYPKIFHQAYYGKLLDVGRAANEHLHVFNFNIDPNLYLYNTITDSLSVVGGRSIYQKTEAKPYSKKVPAKFDKIKQMEYVNQMFIYNKILYDPYRDVYYRIFLKEQSLVNEKGYYNSVFDRIPVIMIFNNTFEVIGEFEIDPLLYRTDLAFVSKQGLCISNQWITNPDYTNKSLSFYVFKFEVN